MGAIALIKAHCLRTNGVHGPAHARMHSHVIFTINMRGIELIPRTYPKGMHASLIRI